MKICIISDSHDNRAYLLSAVTAAKEKGAEAVLHCGDVVAPSTLGVLQPLGLPIHVIHGNNTGDLHMMTRIASKPDKLVHYYGQDAGIKLDGKRIFIVHYPHYARAIATTGEWDLVCYGHDHQALLESVPNMKGTDTILLNPGTVAGIEARPTYAIGDLDTLKFTLHEVEQPQQGPALPDVEGEQLGFHNL